MAYGKAHLARFRPVPSQVAKATHEVRNDVVTDRLDHFIEKDGVRYAGTHLIIDLFGAQRLDDVELMEQTLKRCVEVCGATLLHIHTHHFTPNGGISGVAVLAESHISVHSWPEANYAAFDIFMCGSAEPSRAVVVLEKAFRPARTEVKEYKRGEGVANDLAESGSKKHPPRIVHGS